MTVDSPFSKFDSIDIQDCVFVQVSRLGHFCRPKLDIQRISVLEVFNLHCLKDLSKNALWTVSPSDKSITRRYFPSSSGLLCSRPVSERILFGMPEGFQFEINVKIRPI